MAFLRGYRTKLEYTMQKWVIIKVYQPYLSNLFGYEANTGRVAKVNTIFIAIVREKAEVIHTNVYCHCAGS